MKKGSCTALRSHPTCDEPTDKQNDARSDMSAVNPDSNPGPFEDAVHISFLRFPPPRPQHLHQEPVFCEDAVHTPVQLGEITKN